MKRNRYFDGKLLSPSDLQVEQDYHLDKRRRLNLRLHTPGVISGLCVSVLSGSHEIQIDPGYAIDGQGNEIVVEEPQILPLPRGSAVVSLVVSYIEVLVDPVATAHGMQPSRIEERFEFEFAERDSPWDEATIEVCRLRLVRGKWIVQPRYGSLFALGASIFVAMILGRVFCNRVR